ncbi:MULTISPECIES: ArsR/SmtB family transcription factor [Deinococcus]|uniref:ArsR/SmtB family transcription factor n=1 Tax=Deinococcus rufus TaxID=2136097 RepID=A0ABV7Z9B8_9DEIO|nr:metalloregulator ArsR/SmtB family transcription factor [Deinococcus sp. AB2017081]WQE97352.1 metalloregulator ArsR/SmtB family transcription factor [Deinococcus sp. AB2017081]
MIPRSPVPVLDVLKALASDVRFEIVQLLAHGERCVCDLEAQLALPQSKVSYHMAVLLEAGLVTRDQRGKNSYYSLDRARLYAVGGEVLTALLVPDRPLTHQVSSVC